MFCSLSNWPGLGVLTRPQPQLRSVVPTKAELSRSLRPRSSTPGHLPKRSEHASPRKHMDTNAHGSLTHGSPTLERQMVGAPLNPMGHSDEKPQRSPPCLCRTECRQVRKHLFLGTADWTEPSGRMGRSYILTWVPLPLVCT